MKQKRFHPFFFTHSEVHSANNYFRVNNESLAIKKEERCSSAARNNGEATF